MKDKIVYENGDHWVLANPFKGRTVHKVVRLSASYTHGVVCATIDLRDHGLARAIYECDRRELARLRTP